MEFGICFWNFLRLYILDFTFCIRSGLGKMVLEMEGVSRLASWQVTRRCLSPWYIQQTRKYGASSPGLGLAVSFPTHFSAALIFLGTFLHQGKKVQIEN